MNINIQTLMSALKVQVVVVRYAQTRLEAIHAPVDLVIAWQVISICVMVSPPASKNLLDNKFNGIKSYHRYLRVQRGE